MSVAYKIGYSCFNKRIPPSRTSSANIYKVNLKDVTIKTLSYVIYYNHRHILIGGVDEEK